MMIDAGRVDELRSLLSECQFYPFLSDLTLEWLDRDDTPTASTAERILNEIIRAVIGSMSIDDLSAMLRSAMASVWQAGNVSGDDVASALREFKLSRLAARFNLEEQLTSEEIGRRLRGIAPSTPEVKSEQYGDFLQELKEAGVVLPAAGGASSRKKAAPKPSVAALHLTSMDVKPAIAEAVKPPVAESEPQVNSPAAAKAAVSNRNSKTAVKSVAAPKKSVETYLSPDAKDKVFLKIFREDQDDYDRSMQLINNAKDWKQASIYLDALFMRRKVDPYSKTAVRLTDAVYACFHS